MSRYELICIGCPLGCKMVAQDNKVSGNSCKRGEAYALKEISNPTRVLTSTVKLEKAFINRLPVRTDDAIPKNLVFECMALLEGISVKAPIKIGDVILANVLNTGVNIISSRSIDEINHE